MLIGVPLRKAQSSGINNQIPSAGHVDPLDAILSRTKARKVALQSQKQAQDKAQAEQIQAQRIAQERIRTPQTRPKSPSEEVKPQTLGSYVIAAI